MRLLVGELDHGDGILVGDIDGDILAGEQIGRYGRRFVQVVVAHLERLGQPDASLVVGGKDVDFRMTGIPDLLAYRRPVRIEQLELESGKVHALPGLRVDLHDLQAATALLVVDDVAQLRAVGHLVCGDGPVIDGRDPIRHRLGHLMHGVASYIEGNGASVLIRRPARAKPEPGCAGKTVITGGDGANHAVRGVGDDLELDTRARRLDLRTVRLLGVDELRDLDIERDRRFGKIAVGLKCQRVVGAKIARTHMVLMHGLVEQIACRRLCLAHMDGPEGDRIEPAAAALVRCGGESKTGGRVRCQLVFRAGQAASGLRGAACNTITLLHDKIEGLWIVAGGDIGLEPLGRELDALGVERVAGGCRGFLGVIGGVWLQGARCASLRIGGHGRNMLTVGGAVDFVHGACQGILAVAVAERRLCGCLAKGDPYILVGGDEALVDKGPVVAAGRLVEP